MAAPNVAHERDEDSALAATIYHVIGDDAPYRLRAINVIDMLPSQCTNHDWIHLVRLPSSCPDSTTNGGKWLLFAPFNAIDHAWLSVCDLFTRGLLDNQIKVSTVRGAMGRHEHVICIYSYDGTNKADTLRIGNTLLTLHLAPRLTWKSNEDTRAGRYAQPGTSIAKYVLHDPLYQPPNNRANHPRRLG